MSIDARLVELKRELAQQLSSPRTSRRGEQARGREADRPGEIPPRSWKDIFWRAWTEISDENLFLIAGGVTYAVLLALFPGLAALVSLYGLAFDTAQIEKQVAALSGILPVQTQELLSQEMHSLVEGSKGTLGAAAIIGLLLALWSASRGMSGLITAINIAYEEKERRSFLRFNLIALGLTLGLVVGGVLAIALIAVLPAAVQLLAIGSATKWLLLYRVHVEWDSGGRVTPLGQLPFFIEYLKQAGLFDGWVADCPLTFSSPNAPSKRDLLGTVLLSVLAGHNRYAHITTLRCDAVNPRLLGMKKVVSEDAVRRGLAKIDEAAGLSWLQTHLDYCSSPLLSEPWVLDIDSTIKPLYGQQEGAMVGYNPHKPGRPSHCYHTYMMANLRLVLGVDVQPGDEHTPKHGQVGLWSLLDRIGRDRWPALLRGDVAWGIEPVMARAEQEGLAYLFRLRLTANVKRALTKMMAERDWSNAGHGWQGKETTLRLVGWSRQRRVVLLRRKLDRPLLLVDRVEPEQPLLSFAEIGPDREVWEYAALVTSLDSEILTLGAIGGTARTRSMN